MTRVGIEGDPFVGPRSGVGRYLTGLVDGMSRAASALEPTIVLPRGAEPDVHVRRWLGGTGASVRTPSSLAWHVVRAGNLPGLPVPYQLVAGQQDVFLFTNYRTFHTRGRARATVIYDLGFLRTPETIEPRYLRRLQVYVAQVVDSDTHVITISNAVEQELLDAYPRLRGRLTVLVPGSSTELTSAERDDAAFRDLGLAPGYVLFVGNLEPRKNLLRLLDAYGRLPASFVSEHPLVVVGPPGWLKEAIEARLAELGDRVRRLPYQPDGVLRSLYEHAAALVFPSLYEGFGLPVLEAMALRTPVACSDIPVLREVAGATVRYFNPMDVEAIAASITTTVEATDPKLLDRARTRATTFSWDRTAAQAAALLTNLAR